MNISKNKQVKWDNDNLLKFIIKDSDAIEYISNLIEKENYDKAVNDGNILIYSGKYVIAEVLATKLFSGKMPLENAHLWHEYMNQSISLKGIVDIKSIGRSSLKNSCGLWVVGHHHKNNYTDHIDKTYGERVNKINVQHAYLEKNDDEFVYSPFKLGNMIPITTCFDYNLLKVD
jgi:hypothetical protein